MVRLETELDTWKQIRQDTAQAIEEMTDLDFKATPEMASFREIATHILQASSGLVGLMLEGEETFTGPEFRQKLTKHFVKLPEQPDGATLAKELRDSIDRITTSLATQSPEYYSGIITRVDGRKVTRMEMIQFVKEHELTHRSQLFVYLRLKGIVPSTTRRRMAAQQQK